MRSGKGQSGIYQFRQVSERAAGCPGCCISLEAVVSITPFRDVKREAEAQAWVSAGSVAENLLASLKVAPRVPNQSAQPAPVLAKAA